MSEQGSLRRFLSGSGGIVIGTAVMNVCTFGFTVISAGILDTADYGAFFALLNLLMVLAVLNMGLQATAARRIVAHPDSVAAIERAMLRVATLASLGLGLGLLMLAPLTVWLLQLQSLTPAVVLALLAIPTTLLGAHIGILQGEKRWSTLTWIYVLTGIPRMAGLPLLWWFPNESMAIFGSGLGYIVPAVFGWWVLRRPRDVEEATGVGQVEVNGVLKESLHSSQALLAFFALANVDIVVARHVLSDHESGLYAIGLLVTKIMLFLPQFVVITMFPSLATPHERRRAVLRGTAAILALGALCTLGVALLTGLVADVLHSEKLGETAGSLWLFAVLGTLLSITQLLVYATLARRGRRSIVLVWAGLAVAVALGTLTSSTTALLSVMIGTATVVTSILFAISLRADAGSVGGVVPAAPGAD